MHGTLRERSVVVVVEDVEFHIELFLDFVGFLVRVSRLMN